MPIDAEVILLGDFLLRWPCGAPHQWGISRSPTQGVMLMFAGTDAALSARSYEPLKLSALQTDFARLGMAALAASATDSGAAMSPSAWLDERLPATIDEPDGLAMARHSFLAAEVPAVQHEVLRFAQAYGPIWLWRYPLLAHPETLPWETDDAGRNGFRLPRILHDAIDFARAQRVTIDRMNGAAAIPDDVFRLVQDRVYQSWHRTIVRNARNGYRIVDATESLVGAAWLQLAQAIVRGEEWLQCKDPNCGRWFAPPNGRRHEYHSLTCRNNANARAYRRRRSEHATNK